MRSRYILTCLLSRRFDSAADIPSQVLNAEHNARNSCEFKPIHSGSVTSSMFYICMPLGSSSRHRQDSAATHQLARRDLPRTETTLSAFETAGYTAIIFPTARKEAVETFFDSKQDSSSGEA